MQKCLQKKKGTARFFRTVLVIAAFFGIAIAVTSRNNGISEHSPFKGKYVKYLDLSMNSLGTTLQNNCDNSAAEQTEMNNSDVQNSKNEISAVGIQENPVLRTEKYPRNVNVYMHESKKYQNIPLEEYIVGCVLAEMPSEFESQALMAQAVAVRSFTCSKMNLSGLSSHPDSPVCTDYRHCQSYISPEKYSEKGDYASDAVEKIRQAVNATCGICAFYDGVPITAVYHASSGVRTKSSSEVWGGEVPYLVSVKAPEDRSICSVEYTYSYSDAEKLLSSDDETVRCFSSAGRQVECTYDSEGLVSAMSFSGKVFDKGELKKAFSLRSPDFSAKLTDDGIAFTAFGYGHGVGMSQHGANTLAKNGYGFMDILKYYYSGISFSHIY